MKPLEIKLRPKCLICRQFHGAEKKLLDLHAVVVKMRDEITQNWNKYKLRGGMTTLTGRHQICLGCCEPVNCENCFPLIQNFLAVYINEVIKLIEGPESEESE